MMAALRICFILTLLVALTCARPNNGDGSNDEITNPTTPSTIKPPVKDGSYIYVYNKFSFNKAGSPKYIETKHQRCTEAGTCKDIQHSETFFNGE